MTSLWQNNSPTSIFNRQTVTISDDVNNYSQLKIVFRASTGNSTEFSTIVNVSDFVNTDNTTNKYLGSCTYKATAGIMCRRFYYSSATAIAFSVTDQVAGTNADNNIIIPIEIIGIK